MGEGDAEVEAPAFMPGEDVHQPLKVWILCLYFMGLNLSNDQIAHELSINESDVQQMTAQLRDGIVKKARSDAVQ